MKCDRLSSYLVAGNLPVNVKYRAASPLVSLKVRFSSYRQEKWKYGNIAETLLSFGECWHNREQRKYAWALGTAEKEQQRGEKLQAVCCFLCCWLFFSGFPHCSSIAALGKLHLHTAEVFCKASLDAEGWYSRTENCFLQPWLSLHTGGTGCIFHLFSSLVDSSLCALENVFFPLLYQISVFFCQYFLNLMQSWALSIEDNWGQEKAYYEYCVRFCALII